MYELPNKFPNDSKLRMLVNWKISRKSLKCKGKKLAGPLKQKFQLLRQKAAKKSAVQFPYEVLFHSIL